MSRSDHGLVYCTLPFSSYRFYFRLKWRPLWVRVGRSCLGPMSYHLSDVIKSLETGHIFNALCTLTLMLCFDLDLPDLIPTQCPAGCHCSVPQTQRLLQEQGRSRRAVLRTQSLDVQAVSTGVSGLQTLPVEVHGFLNIFTFNIYSLHLNANL